MNSKEKQTEHCIITLIILIIKDNLQIELSTIKRGSYAAFFTANILSTHGVVDRASGTKLEHTSGGGSSRAVGHSTFLQNQNFPLNDFHYLQDKSSLGINDMLFHKKLTILGIMSYYLLP